MQLVTLLLESYPWPSPFDFSVKKSYRDDAMDKGKR